MYLICLQIVNSMQTRVMKAITATLRRPPTAPSPTKTLMMNRIPMRKILRTKRNLKRTSLKKSPSPAPSPAPSLSLNPAPSPVPNPSPNLNLNLNLPVLPTVRTAKAPVISSTVPPPPSPKKRSLSNTKS